MTDPAVAGVDDAVGPMLRRAWVGYQRRLDDALAAAGFAGRGLPDGRVLRICNRSGAVTVSDIGRELQISRQGASKLVAGLERRGYLTLVPSGRDGREKLVRLTPRAVEYLRAHRRAVRLIDRRLRSEVGDEAVAALRALLEALGADQPRMRDYLRESRARAGLGSSDG